MTLNLYELSGDISTGSRAQLSSIVLSIPDQTLGLFNAAVDAMVPAGSTLLVELLTPDGRSAGNSFVPGSNQTAEMSPTYLEAPDCSVSAPTPAGSSPISRPEMRWVVNVTGS